MDKTILQSPNVGIRPSTAGINALGHLEIGGCDTVELVERFGTPLWLLDEETIVRAVTACLRGVERYPGARVLYAGKAFLCTAMCHLIKRLGLGLDVVSHGELHTGIRAGLQPASIYMHGNNKSEAELAAAIQLGINLVADNFGELQDIQRQSLSEKRIANVLLRVAPGVEPDTHAYIRTGQVDSKFGFPIQEVLEALQLCLNSASIKFLGFHAHIGSQGKELEPYLQLIEIMADLIADCERRFSCTVAQLNLGGGLGITYTEKDKPIPIYEWALAISSNVQSAFAKRALALPMLILEPGRAIVGTAGVTLYRAGYEKKLPGGLRYIAVDGGMADNPRPITYQAQYSACLANRAHAYAREPVTIVGKYCESGDIIVRESFIPAESGDLVAIFGTGAYNYSMASNYNRTPKPACLLVSNGSADIIVERETIDELTRYDRVPPRLTVESTEP